MDSAAAKMLIVIGFLTMDIRPMHNGAMQTILMQAAQLIISGFCSGYDIYNNESQLFGLIK